MAQVESNVEHLSDSVKLEIRDNGQFLIYTVKNTKHNTIDVYISDVMTRLKAWEGGNLAVLHDISDPSTSLTPYFRSKLDEVSLYLRESGKPGYSAVILSDGFMSRFIAIFAQLFDRKNGNFTQRIFTNLDSGMEWIDKQMAQ